MLDGWGESRSERPEVASPRLFQRLPSGLDLRDEVQLESLLTTADELNRRSSSLGALAELESTLNADPTAWPLGARMAVKLARSKRFLAQRSGPLHLSVVLPVYAESQRILRPAEHPLGEGFLDRKLRQLSWLFGEGREQSYDVLIVDDGCPHASGHIAQQILRQRHPRAPARVSFLKDALDAELPVVAPMRSVEDSRKGGSVQYGIWQATRWRRAGHVVLYTDADLSTHLGQAGLLVSALDRPGVRIAAGSRRAASSVVVKSRGRSARGRLFIYLWKKLLPELSYLEDTQCGFKAMPAAVARELIRFPEERGFAFDLELLLKSELRAPRSTAAVPVAWIDSEAASTTTARDPYLAMLRSVVRLYRRHCARRGEADGFARAIESFDDASWQRAIETQGVSLEKVDPALDATTAPILASELQGRAA